MIFSLSSQANRSEKSPNTGEQKSQDTKVLAYEFVRNGQFGTAFCTASGQYTTAICRCHTRAKAMLVQSLTVRGLICSFHCSYIVLLVISLYTSGCKYRDFNLIRQSLSVHYRANERVVP